VVALAGLAGGGFGNWMDRVLLGGVVVDFMNVGIGPVRTGIFNVADLAIMAGALFLAWPMKRHAPPPVVPEQRGTPTGPA
jgi:signal peptidase II